MEKVNQQTKITKTTVYHEYDTKNETNIIKLLHHLDCRPYDTTVMGHTVRKSHHNQTTNLKTIVYSYMQIILDIFGQYNEHTKLTMTIFKKLGNLTAYVEDNCLYPGMGG
jgi:hypothetical protein